MTFRAVVTGCGAYLPEQILTNADLARRVDTSDEWIRERTGIRERHIAAPGERTSDLAVNAARAAMRAADVNAADIDLIIVATTTPDLTFPATAAIVQAKLGVLQGAAFDIQAVCTGFIYALATAEKFLASGQHRRALVIGAETFRAFSTGRIVLPASFWRRGRRLCRRGDARGGRGRARRHRLLSAHRRRSCRSSLC